MGDFGITAHGPSMFFLTGELDMATVPIMNVAIADAVSRGGPIMTGIADLTFLDSSGVGAITGSVKTLPDRLHRAPRRPRWGREGARPHGRGPSHAEPSRHPVLGRRRSSEGCLVRSHGMRRSVATQPKASVTRSISRERSAGVALALDAADGANPRQASGSRRYVWTQGRRLRMGDDVVVPHSKQRCRSTSLVVCTPTQRRQTSPRRRSRGSRRS